MCCSCQLQRQRDSCVVDVRDMENCKQTLKDGAFIERVMTPV